MEITKKQLLEIGEVFDLDEDSIMSDYSPRIYDQTCVGLIVSDPFYLLFGAFNAKEYLKGYGWSNDDIQNFTYEFGTKAKMERLGLDSVIYVPSMSVIE